jgi:hypothetical protein
LPGYSVIYNGKQSHIKPGKPESLNEISPAVGYEHFEHWTQARKALADYFAHERDEWAYLARVARYSAAYQLWSGAIPKRVKERRRIK